MTCEVAWRNLTETFKQETKINEAKLRTPRRIFKSIEQFNDINLNQHIGFLVSSFGTASIFVRDKVQPPVSFQRTLVLVHLLQEPEGGAANHIALWKFLN